jgi:hypothetical protein
MQIQNHTPALECSGAISDLILQAARQAIPAHVDQLMPLPDSGRRNQPLMPLLVGLIDAAQVIAKAVADNAWDDCLPIERKLAADLAKQARAIAADLENATQCPDARGWSLPSMTGKELV